MDESDRQCESGRVSGQNRTHTGHCRDRKARRTRVLGLDMWRPILESSLVNRNIVIDGRRTSVRLEPQMWDALAEIARREGRTVHDVCSVASRLRHHSTLTAGLRVFLLRYFREAATAEGHTNAGHGDGFRLVGEAAAARAVAV